MPLSKTTKWILVLAFFVLVGVVVMTVNPAQYISDVPTEYQTSGDAQQEQQERQPVFSGKIGEEGFLRFSGSDTVPVLLAVTLEDYQELKKVLTAKDEYGLLELAGRVFGVSKGTRVRIIDKSGVLLRVRILEGVNPVDEDKVGLSGWVPGGWVYAQ